jgi:hypothetical protein
MEPGRAGEGTADVGKLGILGIEVYNPKAARSDITNAAAGKREAGEATDLHLADPHLVEFRKHHVIEAISNRHNSNSAAMAVVSALFASHNVDQGDVGRLDVVGDSHLVDGGQTARIVQQLFCQSSVCGLEVSTTVCRSCAEEANVLINALLWCDSSSWDGRYAVILIVNPVGAVALLLGRGANLNVNMFTRTMQWLPKRQAAHKENIDANAGASSEISKRLLKNCYDAYTAKKERLKDRKTVNRIIDVNEEAVRKGGRRFYPGFLFIFMGRIAEHLSEAEDGLILFTYCEKQLVGSMFEVSLNRPKALQPRRGRTEGGLTSTSTLEKVSDVRPSALCGVDKSDVIGLLQKQTSVFPRTLVESCHLQSAQEPRENTHGCVSGPLRVVITGISAAVPSVNDSLSSNSTGAYSFDAISRIINGENFISSVPFEVKQELIDKNVAEVVKSPSCTSGRKVVITDISKTIQLRTAPGEGTTFSLSTSYGVAESVAATMDRAVQLAVAVGLEALKDAGIVMGWKSGEAGTASWVLPTEMQVTTGVVYATSFPALDTAIAEVSRFYKSVIDRMKAANDRTRDCSSSRIAGSVDRIKAILKQKLVHHCLCDNGGHTASLVDDVVGELDNYLKFINDELHSPEDAPPCQYEFDRKFLFRVLVLANAQLAQIIKAKGPNMQTNTACAGAAAAVAVAFDMIQCRRVERMVVIASDDASSDLLLPWIGNGFRALGATTIKSTVGLIALRVQPS